MKTITNIIYPAFAAIVLTCFAHSAVAQKDTPTPTATPTATENPKATPTATIPPPTPTPTPFSGEDRGNGNSAAENVDALNLGTTGSENTAHGWFSLFSNTTGSQNTADGFRALTSNTTGGFNTAIGHSALESNDTGGDNTAVGHSALQNNIDGFLNTAVGERALINMTTGTGNIALGQAAGLLLTNGNDNIYIGHTAGAAENDTIRIGLGGLQTKTFIAGISGVNEGGTISTVYINADGQLGTTPPASSRRFKKEIKPMDKTSEAVLGFKPVTFQYKSDTKGTPQFGLIAEEVAEINPDLVVRNADGEIYSVRYDAVNAMLLNEFLKEHRKNEEQGRDIQEQKATIALQQKQIDALTAGLQKVSAQIEVSKPAPQTVNNP